MDVWLFKRVPFTNYRISMRKIASHLLLYRTESWVGPWNELVWPVLNHMHLPACCTMAQWCSGCQCYSQTECQSVIWKWNRKFIAQEYSSVHEDASCGQLVLHKCWASPTITGTFPTMILKMLGTKSVSGHTRHTSCSWTPRQIIFHFQPNSIQIHSFICPGDVLYS